MRINIARAAAVMICTALLLAAVPCGVFAEDAYSVYLLGGDSENAFLDDTIAVELNTAPTASAAEVSLTENGTKTETDYDISVSENTVYIKFNGLKKGSSYVCRISGICGKPIDFAFKTAGYEVLAKDLKTENGKTSAVMKSGYSKPHTAAVLTAYYGSGGSLKSCSINNAEINPRTEQSVSFDTGYTGEYDTVKAFVFADFKSLRPADTAETKNRIKPLYYENFDSTYTTDGSIQKYMAIQKESEFSVKTVNGERCLSMNITKDDMFFQYNFGKAVDGDLVCGFDMMLTDSDQVTKLIQFIGTGGADAFAMMIHPDGGAYILNKDFSLGPKMADFEKNVFNKIDICVNPNRGIMNIYINGVKKTNDYTFDYGALSAFRIHQWYPNGKKGEVLIDNIRVYEWDSIVADEQIERGIHMDIKKIMKNAVAMYVGKSNVLLHGVKSYISDDRSVVPYEDGEKIMVPVRFFAESIGAEISGGRITDGNRSFAVENENGYADVRALCNAFGKSLHLEKNGIIIYSDESLEDVLDWQENMKFMRTVSESYMFDDVTGDEIYNLLREKNRSHPRLVMTEDRFESVRKELAKGSKCDATMKKAYDNLKHYADIYLEQEPVEYSRPDGIRLLQAASENAARMVSCSLMYNITKEEKYADKAWDVMSAVAGFKDWNPFHFLDVGELAAAMGLSYDMMYNWMSAEQRSVIRTAIVEKAIYPIIDDFDHLTREDYSQSDSKCRSWNWRGELADNWCLVIATVGTCGALSIIDELEGDDLAKAKRTVVQCLEDMRRALSLFAPMGAYEEGPNYWRFAMKFYAYSMRSLENSVGNCFGYDDVTGLKFTNMYLLAINGSKGIFNYHDGSNSYPLYAPEMFYLADRFNKYNEAVPRINRMKVTWADSSDFAQTDIMYYDTKFGSADETGASLDAYLPISEIASMRSGWNSSDTYVGFHCDDPISGEGHDHMDAGTFVLDALGEKFFFDLGSDNYNIPNYLQCYRVRAEGHNTVIFNPDKNYAFKYGGTASIVKHSFGENESYAVGDMTNVYTADKGVKSFLRGVKLDNGRKRVTVQDKFVLERPVEMYWFAHTDADIEVSEDKKTAVLTKNGKKLLARIVSGNGAEFSVMDAKPLPTSPVIAEQNPNDGIRKLTIHIENCESNEICVTFVDYNDSASGEYYKPLEQW